MSLLSRYLRSLRARRRLTDLRLVKTTNVDLGLYKYLEANPEQVPLDHLYLVFEALKITREEFAEFNYIAVRLLREKRGPSPAGKAEPEVTNILEFKDRRGLNGRPKNTKKLTQDSGLE